MNNIWEMLKKTGELYVCMCFLGGIYLFLYIYLLGFNPIVFFPISISDIAISFRRCGVPFIILWILCVPLYNTIKNEIEQIRNSINEYCLMLCSIYISISTISMLIYYNMYSNMACIYIYTLIYMYTYLNIKKSYIYCIHNIYEISYIFFFTSIIFYFFYINENFIINIYFINITILNIILCLLLMCCIYFSSINFDLLAIATICTIFISINDTLSVKYSYETYYFDIDNNIFESKLFLTLDSGYFISKDNNVVFISKTSVKSIKPKLPSSVVQI